jgi:hypothetical protein
VAIAIAQVDIRVAWLRLVIVGLMRHVQVGQVKLAEWAGYGL